MKDLVVMYAQSRRVSQTYITRRQGAAPTISIHHLFYPEVTSVIYWTKDEVPQCTYDFIFGEGILWKSTRKSCIVLHIQINFAIDI